VTRPWLDLLGPRLDLTCPWLDPPAAFGQVADADVVTVLLLRPCVALSGWVGSHDSGTAFCPGGEHAKKEARLLFL
jgi:hypothetical protein